MYTMNVSQWMDKVGNAFVNTVLLAALPTATVTFKDADVTLLAGSDVAQADFDRVAGDL